METPVEVLPPVNPIVARSVLLEVDSLINWQKNASAKAEKAGMRLARLVASVAENQYWIAVGMRSEKEYIEKTFPQSESQYYILKRVGGTLAQYPAEVLEEIGMSKCQDLVRIHNHCGIIGANWFLWAKSDKRDQFRIRVRAYIAKSLPPPKSEEDKLVGFKVWQSAVPVVNRAMEIAALESGSDSKSNNFVLICADFLAGHNDDGPRVKSGNLALKVIRESILSLKDACREDATILERLIGVFRTSIEELKDGNDSEAGQD